MEFDGPVSPAEIKGKIPLKEWMIQHRKRWLFRSSKGDLVLKKITALDLEETTFRLVSRVPDFFELQTKAKGLWLKAKAPNGLSPEEMKSLIELGERLTPLVREYLLKCFDHEAKAAENEVLPQPRTAEELDVLLGVLEPGERDELLALLTELSKGQMDGDANLGNLGLTKTFGGPLPSDLSLENMTAEQAGELIKANDRYNAEMEHEIRRIQRAAR